MHCTSSELQKVAIGRNIKETLKISSIKLSRLSCSLTGYFLVVLELVYKQFNYNLL